LSRMTRKGTPGGTRKTEREHIMAIITVDIDTESEEDVAAVRNIIQDVCGLLTHQSLVTYEMGSTELSEDMTQAQEMIVALQTEHENNLERSGDYVDVERENVRDAVQFALDRGWTPGA